MTVSTDDIQRAYEQFNGGDLGPVVDQFALNAEYRQVDSGQVATGHDEIRGVMEGWKHFFAGARIEGIKIQEAPVLAREVDGAVQCFVVDFTGVGVYENTMPGLEEIAPAHGREVHLPIGETVWIDGDGKFLRVDNTIKVMALQ